MIRGVLTRGLYLLLAFAGAALQAQDKVFYKKLFEEMQGLAATNPPAARARIDGLIALHPLNPRYYYLRGGFTHHELDEPLLAIADYNRALDLFAREKEDPEDQIYKERAKEWLRLGELEKARADLDTVAERWPKRAFQLIERGLVCCELGDYEGAARQFVSFGNAHGSDVEISVWTLLCQAKMEDLPRARQGMLPAKPEARAPMSQIYALFKGAGSPEQVSEAARAAGPRGNQPPDLPPSFYAEFYLGLYSDLTGDPTNAIAHLQAALDVRMSHSMMQDIARVHRDRLLRQSQTTFRPVPAAVLQPRRGLGHFFGKLKPGGQARVAFFGGSITAADDGWRSETMDWLRQTHPGVQFTEINAAIGGTGSDLGVFRFQQDVLSQKPDLVFVEFSVNDGGAPPAAIWRALEGVLRQAWRADESVDFCFIYTFANGLEKELQAGLCPRAASSDEILAHFYDLPSINMALPVAERAAAKTLQIRPEPETSANGTEAALPPGVMLFSKDGVHPLREGHHLYFETIRDGLKAMSALRTPPHWLKSPFLTDNWENARLSPLSTNMMTGEWKSSGDPAAERFKSRLPEVWTTSEPGAGLSFKFKGTAFGFYDIIGPDSGRAVCVIDGRTNAPVSRFDSFCSYHRLASFLPATRLTNGPHEVRLYLDAEPADKRTVLEREKGKPGFDPKPYEKSVLRVGGLMIAGELIHE